mmetsp:Transcript_68184/g.200224  ORF Transcript_68184/g.200224 Transcript_68184/m.200224 type:complete len:145 (-) Transcript_68184:126-560(-)
MGRKAKDSDSESESEAPRKDKKKREEKKRPSRSRSRGARKDKREKSRGRSEEKEKRDKRKDRSESSSSKSSEDDEEMKDFAILSTDMPEEQMMAKMMGFNAFDTSKGKDHSGSDLSDVKRATKRQYRQYMNRRGGFNRPLDAAF